MNRDWNYIEKEGKQLKTVDDFKNWYVRTVKAHKKQDSNFNEKKFEEETRKEIIALRDSILTDNTESKKYKFILLRFIGEFLNKKALILKSKYDPAPDQFPRIYNWFIEQLDNIKDIDLQKEFIESEIEKTKKTSISWINNGTDLKDKFLKADFDAGQKYLVFLKQRLINYQHTPTASAHEKIVKDYNSLGNYLPQEEEELLLAEELENRLIIEGVNYKHVLSERWETFQFDKEYFKKFIPHSLYSEFIYSLYAKLEPWNNQEINRYLTLSIAQFKRFHPEYREQQFIKKFAACYWYPNVVEKVYEDEEHYAKFVLKEFTAHYNLFVKEAERALENLQEGIIGATVGYKTQNSFEDFTATNGINVKNFFDRITEGSITQIEIVNTVEKLTNNFHLGKLNVLLDDFGLHFMMAKEQYESQFTDDNIIEAIAENEKNGMPIPYIKFPALKTKKGEKKLPKNVIDKEKLLYPYDFYTAYQFKHFLNDRIKEAEKIKIIPKQKNELEPEIFDNSIPKEKSDFILKMLEDVGITTNGKTKLGRKGAYHIRAVVEAAIEKNILPKRILHFTKLICDKIDHPISSKLARSKDFDSLVRRYKVYIDANYKTTLAE